MITQQWVSLRGVIFTPLAPQSIPIKQRSYLFYPPSTTWINTHLSWFHPPECYHLCGRLVRCSILSWHFLLSWLMWGRRRVLLLLWESRCLFLLEVWWQTAWKIRLILIKELAQHKNHVLFLTKFVDIVHYIILDPFVVLPIISMGCSISAWPSSH